VEKIASSLCPNSEGGGWDRLSVLEKTASKLLKTPSLTRKNTAGKRGTTCRGDFEDQNKESSGHGKKNTVCGRGKGKGWGKTLKWNPLYSSAERKRVQPAMQFGADAAR